MTLSAHPFLSRLVEHIESAETLGVSVFEIFEFIFQEDVFFGDVAEDEGDFCFVGGVVEDCAAELVHTVTGVRLMIWLKGKGSREGTYGVMPVPPAMRQM